MSGLGRQWFRSAHGHQFLRKHLRSTLRPAKWQHQAHDHVLHEHERAQGAFQAIAHYILENPVRAHLVESANRYIFLGCCVPGYPDLHPSQPDYWEKFWRIHNRLVEAAPDNDPATRSRS